MALRKNDNPDLYDRIQEKNLLRQYDLLTNCIEIGLEKGVDAFDKYTLWALNYAAVSNICQHGGRYRKGPIYVSNHIPPHFETVPEAVDQMISLVQENWETVDSPTTLAAYVLWRLNWIHPFIEGNGRTARAACYYLLSLKQGKILQGKKIVPERIRDDRKPYYDALREADVAWAQGHFNVSSLDAYLQKLFLQQIKNAD